MHQKSDRVGESKASPPDDVYSALRLLTAMDGYVRAHALASVAASPGDPSVNGAADEQLIQSLDTYFQAREAQKQKEEEGGLRGWDWFWLLILVADLLLLGLTIPTLFVADKDYKDYGEKILTWFLGLGFPVCSCCCCFQSRSRPTR